MYRSLRYGMLLTLGALFLMGNGAFAQSFKQGQSGQQSGQKGQFGSQGQSGMQGQSGAQGSQGGQAAGKSTGGVTTRVLPSYSGYLGTYSLQTPLSNNVFNNQLYNVNNSPFTYSPAPNLNNSFATTPFFYGQAPFLTIPFDPFQYQLFANTNPFFQFGPTMQFPQNNPFANPFLNFPAFNNFGPFPGNNFGLQGYGFQGQIFGNNPFQQNAPIVGNGFAGFGGFAGALGGGIR